MVSRRTPSLPDGYRAVEDRGTWYLFDSRNELLARSAEPAAIQEQAWRDAWRRVDRELKDELAAFRAGTLPLERLRRVRQYLGMLDAVARVSAAPATRRSVSWRAPAAVAAAAALLIGAMSVGLTPERPVRPPSVAMIAKPHPPAGETPTAVPSVAPAHAAMTAREQPRQQPRAAVSYAVSVGRFASPTAADRMKHIVRSKGYVVDVLPRGTVSVVVTPPLATRLQAEYVVNGLAEIGFPAELVAWRAL